MKPTEEMIVAGMEASVIGRPSVDDETYVLSIWDAMQAARPAPEPGNLPPEQIDRSGVLSA